LELSRAHQFTIKKSTEAVLEGSKEAGPKVNAETVQILSSNNVISCV